MSVPACQRRQSRRNECSCVNALPLLMTRLLRAACVDALQQMGVAMARQRVLRVLLTLLFRKRLLQQRLLTQLEQHPRPPHCMAVPHAALQSKAAGSAGGGLTQATVVTPGGLATKSVALQLLLDRARVARQKYA